MGIAPASPSRRAKRQHLRYLSDFLSSFSCSTPPAVPLPLRVYSLQQTQTAGARLLTHPSRSIDSAEVFEALAICCQRGFGEIGLLFETGNYPAVKKKPRPMNPDYKNNDEEEFALIEYRAEYDKRSY